MMKFPMIIAAASLALMPAFASAQSTTEDDDNQQVGGAPLEGGLAQEPIVIGAAISEAMIIGAAGVAVLGAGLGVALGGGGGDNGTPTTTTTTTTTN